MSTSAGDSVNIISGLHQKVSRPAGAELWVATQPNLRMYKSEAGFNAIMSWYEVTQASIPVPVESLFVCYALWPDPHVGGWSC